MAAADSQSNVQSNKRLETSASPELQQNTNNGRSQRNTKTVQTRKASKCCDSTKITRSNREKMLQEKEDFQLAKMLQECVGTTDAPSRYSLRSRNKSSVSSLSSTSSSQELFHGKGYSVNATPKFNKKPTIPFSDNTKELMVGRSQRNDTNDKFIDFTFQKLTRSRRIAMTMSGV